MVTRFTVCLKHQARLDIQYICCCFAHTIRSS